MHLVKASHYFSFLVLLIVGSACSMNGLTLRVSEPAPVYVPPDLRRAGVLNRSEPTSKTNEVMDEIDKILTAEGKNLDRDGAEETINGLSGLMQQRDRFDEILRIDIPNLRNPGGPVYPEPLSAELVDQICREHDIEVLFVLSFYDTDSRVDYDMVPVDIDVPLAGKVTAMEHQATVNTVIKAGWRIYDGVNKTIRDEFIQSNNTQTSGRGINPMNAVRAVIGRKQVVLDASNTLGRVYAERIFPFQRRVRREYFVKGSPKMKIAKRRAQTGNWDGAGDLWEEETDSPKRKLAGRAHYNMAIISEINGDLDAAIEWASQAYTDYKIKQGLDYVNILKNRVYRNEVLEQQQN